MPPSAVSAPRCEARSLTSRELERARWSLAVCNALRLRAPSTILEAHDMKVGEIETRGEPLCKRFTTQGEPKPWRALDPLPTTVWNDPVKSSQAHRGGGGGTLSLQGMRWTTQTTAVQASLTLGSRSVSNLCWTHAFASRLRIIVRGAYAHGASMPAKGSPCEQLRSSLNCSLGRDSSPSRGDQGMRAAACT